MHGGTAMVAVLFIFLKNKEIQLIFQTSLFLINTNKTATKAVSYLGSLNNLTEVYGTVSKRGGRRHKNYLISIFSPISFQMGETLAWLPPPSSPPLPAHSVYVIRHCLNTRLIAEVPHLWSHQLNLLAGLFACANPKRLNSFTNLHTLRSEFLIAFKLKGIRS